MISSHLMNKKIMLVKFLENVEAACGKAWGPWEISIESKEQKMVEKQQPLQLETNWHQ